MDESFSLFIEQIPSGLMVIGADGNIQLANTYLHNMFGYAQEALPGISVESLLPESERAKHILLRQAYIQSPEIPAMGEGRVVSALKKDGSEFKVEVCLKMLNGDDQTVLATVKDVSRREMAMDALHISQQINKTETWSFDLKSDTVYWSPELFRIFGLPPAQEAPPYETHQALFSADSWRKLEPAVAAAAEHGTAYELELELASQRGQARYAVARCEPQLNATGEVIGLEGTFQDVTSLKKAEIELEETALRLNESVVAGQIGLWDWNLQTNNVNYSKEYKRQLGYAEDEFGDFYQEWESRVHPDDLGDVLKNVKNSIDNQSKSHEALFRMQHKDGSYRWILAHASIFKDEQGLPLRMLGSHIDITEQKKMEEQLRQSQKMEAMGQLSGGVAHDFNNQLASILGFAELIMCTEDLPQIKKYAQKVIAAAEDSGSLTKQLLSFSRQDAVELKPVDVHQQLNDMTALLNRTLDKRIDIKLKLTSEFAMTMGDKSILQNAFLNLGLNARDAMQEGGILEISTEYLDKYERKNQDNAFKSPCGPFIKISFKDSGCGIPDIELTRIFEPFYTTKELGDGTGLGLALVYSAIDRMQGEINVRSTVGKGTCFDIYLPLDFQHRHQFKGDAVETGLSTDC